MLMRRPSPPPSKATATSSSFARSTSPETTLVSSASVPRRASSSQRSMPARLPVVTELQASAAPGLVSTTFRSGLRKLTGAFRVEKVDRRKSRDAIAGERQCPLPHRLAATTAVLRALPAHAHAAAEIGGREWPRRLHDLGAVQHIKPLDGRSADDFGGKLHRHRARADDVAHRGLAHRELLPARELRVFGKARDRLREA